MDIFEIKFLTISAWNANLKTYSFQLEFKIGIGTRSLHCARSMHSSAYLIWLPRSADTIRGLSHSFIIHIIFMETFLLDRK